MNLAEPIRLGAAAHRAVVHCLGRFRLHDRSGRPRQVRTRKARAVIAALAVSNRPMSRDALADLLWSDRGEAQARASLRQTIFELQHGAGEEPVLVAARDDISVRPDLLVTDIELIRDAAARSDWQGLVDRLQEAEPGLLTDLDGLDEEFDCWLRGERAHEPARTLAVALEAAEHCIGVAGPRVALDIVSEILRLDPTHEEATRLAMRIDGQLGDSGAVHRHFHALKERLREDYGVEPSTETARLLATLADGNGASSPSPSAAELRADAEHASAERNSRKVPWVASAAAMILVISAALLLLFSHDRRGAPPQHAVLVAVLPFEEQPPDGSFLAAGLWEQTRGALTRNRSIHVLGRATTEAMASRKLAPDQYLKRLGVTHILEGTVRRAGRDLLVSVSLTRTDDGIAVWQERFRGRMGEPFAVQDAIVNGIEGKLRAQLAPGGGRRAEQISTSPEVYALYSEARQLIASREFDNVIRAEALLRRAVKADPNYAPSWSLLGEAIFFGHHGAIADAGARAEALAAAQRALSLAPNFAGAHAAMALIQGELSKVAEARLRRALALDPGDSEAWNWLANSLVAQGRSREAIAAYERAIKIDPLFYPAVENLFMTASEAEDQAAIIWLFRTISRAGASADLMTDLKARQAYARGDLSASVKLLAARGFGANGHARAVLWDSWFRGLTALGYYDKMHRATGCPDWYAPLLEGRTLPPKMYDGRPVAPAEFWTSVFFSAPASRTMVRRGHSRDLVKLYRGGFEDADDFITRTDRLDLLAELAPNLAIALRSTGSVKEGDYLLAAASNRLEAALKHGARHSAAGRLAIIRAAQGDRTQALATLERAVRNGWFPDGRAVALDLAQEPAFRGLRGDPQFETVRKHILDHIARERAELGPIAV